MSETKKPSVLIVEDDQGIREGLEELLEDEGYDVKQAANGKDALTVLSKYSPSVILLDLMMPVMNGVAFLDALRQDMPRIAEQIPVLLLTAAGDKANSVKGVKAIIRKPIDIEALLSEISKAQPLSC